MTRSWVFIKHLHRFTKNKVPKKIIITDAVKLLQVSTVKGLLHFDRLTLFWMWPLVFWYKKGFCLYGFKLGVGGREGGRQFKDADGCFLHFSFILVNDQTAKFGGNQGCCCCCFLHLPIKKGVIAPALVTSYISAHPEDTGSILPCVKLHTELGQLRRVFECKHQESLCVWTAVVQSDLSWLPGCCAAFDTAPAISHHEVIVPRLHII